MAARRRTRGGALMRPRVILVPDGMADEPLPALDGRTPLQAAATPVMDAMAGRGVVGLVQTIPGGMAPGSDVANLSVLGYDAAALYTGRSPLEAASIGVDLGPDDVAYRCNLVTIADGVMRDNTAGHISTEQARVLIAALAEAFAGSPFEFHPGVGYRHLLVWRGGETAPCTPPHDILDRPIGAYLPPGPAGAALRQVMQTAHELLGRLRPGTDIWLWGEGRAPRLPRFADLYGLRGAVVGAVDLIRGLGVYAGLDVLEVPGATGGLDTDYAAKGRVARAALASYDFVYVHVEAPDEAAHMGSVQEKVRAIERVDADVLSPLWEAERRPAVLVLPDHLTPIRTRTHATPPVPFVYAVPDLALVGPAAPAYDEAAAAATGLSLASGAELMTRFLMDTA
jgi:2,3-bisphosphoglycerate-independent phosphoglycerate mutase